VAAALAAGAGLPAQAASATGWRAVSSQHYGSATAHSGLHPASALAIADSAPVMAVWDRCLQTGARPASLRAVPASLDAA